MKAVVRAIFEARLMNQGVELLVIGGDFDEVKKGFDQVIFPADKVVATIIGEARLGRI